jgi:hypothetical protein
MKRRPWMMRKRTLVMVLLLLTGGAIINVAVAWGCVRWSPPPPSSATPKPDNVSLVWFGSGTDSRTPQQVQTLKWFGVCINYVVMDIPPRYYYSMEERNCGWPLLTLSGAVDYRQITTTCMAIWPRVEGKNVNYLSPNDGRLPFRPLWPGFAINTIFYAAILWLLCVAPFALRRRIRARRGQCPACAYPIGTSDVCTECGRPLK